MVKSLSLAVLLSGVALMQVGCSLVFSASGEGSADGDGGPVGADAAPTEGDYFIAPDGDDSASGTREAPFLTWERALSALDPGEILVAKDGVYDPDVNGLPFIDCRFARCGNNACADGTEDNPIQVVADHQARAWLKANDSSTEASLTIRNCNYWQVRGLRASGADRIDGPTGVVEINDSSNIELSNLFIHDTNRMESSELMEIRNSSDVVVDGLEAYKFHRSAVSIVTSANVSVRNSYISGDESPDRAGGDESDSDCLDRGDIGVSFRGTTDGHLDSSIVEAVCDGVEIIPVPNGTVGTAKTHLSNILVMDARESGVNVESSCDSACAPFDTGCDVSVQCPGRRDVVDTVISNALIVDSDKGFEFEGPVGAVLSHITSIAHGGEAIHVKLGDASNVVLTQSLSVDHSLIIEGNNGVRVDADTGIDVVLDWLRLFGNGTNLDYDPATTKVNAMEINETPANTSECYAYMPVDSVLATEDGDEGVGANIRYRSVDGALSNVPMWNANTGAFSCRPDLGDDFDYPTARCQTTHERFRIGGAGCPAPYNP